MHLYALDGTPAGIKTVRIFQWIAVVLLCIACINYVNLVMARASRRRQEIGFRRVMGARRKQLFEQFIREAGILFFFASIAAILLNVFFLPAFNALSGKEFSSFLWMNKDIWLISGIMLLSVIIMAGLYPAWTLASFQPAKTVRKKKSSGFFKTLIVLQYVASVVLIIVTIAMQAQLNYIRKKDLGFDREYVFTCGINTRNGNFDVIKNELLKNTAIREVSSANEEIVDATDIHTISDWEGRMSDVTLNHGRVWADTSFFRTMRMSFVEGDGFTHSYNSEEQYVINETAVKAMGMEKPVVGKWMVASGGIRGTIVSVVKDFHFSNFRNEIEPMVFRPANVGTLYVRTTANDASNALAAVEQLWKQYNPEEPFTYKFLDDTFNRMYRSDIQTGSLFTVISLIVILISCLGLFGLVTYTAEAKTKEIGICKVFGASVSDIVTLLSKEFLLLVVVAMFIAFPLAYYWLDTMLQDYAYRISIGWWIFALAGVITIALTLLSVSRQAFKAATANPIEAIKND
jgi:putative ABC transport system permease protein